MEAPQNGRSSPANTKAVLVFNTGNHSRNKSVNAHLIGSIKRPFCTPIYQVSIPIGDLGRGGHVNYLTNIVMLWLLRCYATYKTTFCHCSTSL